MSANQRRCAAYLLLLRRRRHRRRRRTRHAPLPPAPMTTLPPHRCQELLSFQISPATILDEAGNRSLHYAACTPPPRPQPPACSRERRDPAP